MKQLDLFAGIGGISLAAEWAGIETVAFCEREPFCQDILRRRFPGRPIYGDVFDLTREVLERDGITGIDIVAGGFPCQPFSHAGKRKGTADDRYLWPEMHRIINELRPAWVFAENVDGLVSMAQSDWNLVMEDETTLCEEAEMVLETIRKDLETIGYRSVPIVVPACGVGASHRRYRIFILGYTEHDGLSTTTFGRSIDSAGNNQSERAEQTSESQGAGRRTSDEVMAYSTCELPYRSQGEGQGRNEHSDGGENVANTSCTRREECDDAAITDQSGHDSGRGDAGRSNGTTQPGLGGSPYELSDWLDGWGMNPLDALINFIASFPQPALMGQPQHDWEPPRIATGVKNRAARLKALGNAVNPLQALPILYGIRVLHEQVRK